MTDTMTIDERIAVLETLVRSQRETIETLTARLETHEESIDALESATDSPGTRTESTRVPSDDRRSTLVRLVLVGLAVSLLGRRLTRRDGVYRDTRTSDHR